MSPKGLPRWLSDKESTYQCRRLEFDPWVGKISWRRKRQPTPIFLPEKSHGQRSLEALARGKSSCTDVESGQSCTVCRGTCVPMLSTGSRAVLCRNTLQELSQGSSLRLARLVMWKGQVRGQEHLHLPVSWHPPSVSKGTGLTDTAGPLRFPAAHLESSGPRTTDAGVACPPGVPGLKYIFPALLFSTP